MTQFILPEYPRHTVLTTGQKGALERVLTAHHGVLPTVDRFAGRSFCTPGRRLNLEQSMLYPDWRVDPSTGKVIGSDEWWGCCTTPIITGAMDKNTGETPFREGEAHVRLPDMSFVSLQELIEEDPVAVIGERHETFTRSEFGKPTWGIVSKKFDNLNPIPFHLHWSKWETYDINKYDNPNVHPSHYHTTGMGLYAWVTPEDFLASMQRFGQPEGNGVRELAPHMFMPVGKGGFCMPNGVLHSPTNLCTHETHVRMDEHFLAESLTLDGEIPAEVAFLACREMDYPRERHGDWEYLASRIDFAANQDPDFVKRNSRPPLRADQYCSDGVEAHWVTYGEFLGEQRCSVLRIIIRPGALCNLNFDSPSFFHTNEGQGQVGGLKVQRASNIAMGTFHQQSGFITQTAIEEPGGVQFKNLGEEEFVVTLDFPQDAHLTTPGM